MVVIVIVYPALLMCSVLASSDGEERDGQQNQDEEQDLLPLKSALSRLKCSGES